MYKLEILPIAKKDIDDIIYYIYKHFKNPIAAQKLSQEFISGANTILEFPYGTPIYNQLNKLNYEYRSKKIKNFLMFYTINENEKIITIVRVLYNKMNVNQILN